MRKLLFVFFLFIATTNSYSQYGWYLQNSGTTNDLHGVAFTNDSIGIAVGLHGTIRKTFDGGNSWNIISVGLSQNLHKIAVTNSEKWTIIGEAGLILYSTSRGNTWTPKSSGVNVNLNRIYFLKKNGVASDTGFIAGVGGVLLKTTNGGESWGTITTPTNQNLYCVYFLDENTGYTAGQGVILKTTNAGNNWATITPNLSKTYHAIVFKDANTGVVVGGVGFYFNGIIYRTIDGGQSWIEYSNLSYDALKAAVELPNGNFGVIGNNSLIINSSNQGLDWVIQSTSGNSGTLLQDLCFVNNYTGYTVGNFGYIYKTQTGGTTAISNISTEIPSSFNLHQNYPNPFNPVTKIRFDLPESGNVSLSVFNTVGQEVKSLVNSNLNAGSYEYSFDGGELSSGVYYYKLISNGVSEIKKMVLAK